MKKCSMGSKKKEKGSEDGVGSEKEKGSEPSEEQEVKPKKKKKARKKKSEPSEEQEQEASKPKKKKKKKKKAGLTSQHHMVFRSYGSDPKYLGIIRISSSLHEWSTVDVTPVFAGKKTPSFVAACKELFCLTFDWEGDYILWNSLTNESKSIPESKLELPACCCVDHDSPSTCTRSVSPDLFALGFDSEACDYKLLKFTGVRYYDDTTFIHTHSIQRHINVYSLSSNSWREIPDPGFYYFCRHNKASLNGICYWVHSKHITLSNESAVVAFDFASEEFSILPIPDVPLSRDTCYDLIDFNGSLAFVVWSWSGVSKCFRFWILDVVNGVSAWVRKEKLDVVGTGVQCPLGFCRSGGSLLLQGMNGGLFEYDYYAQNMKKIEDIYYHHHHQGVMRLV